MPIAVVAALLASLLANAATAAAPIEVRVERWSATWSTYDEFDDGVLPDGDADETRLYEAPCAPIDDTDEASGRVRLAGPGAACSGAAVLRPRVLLAPDFSVRARFALVAVPAGTGLGITITASDGVSRRDLALERGPLLGAGSDAIGLSLYANDAPVERTLLSADAPTWLAANPTIELVLVATGGSAGLPSVPHARFRTCPLDGCSAAVPYLDVPDFGPPGGGAIGGSARWRLAFFADAPASFAIDLHAWDLDMNAADELDIFENRMEYGAQCAELRVENGGLVATLVDRASCDGSIAAATVQAPGAESVAATFAWSLPEPCTAGFGIGLLAESDSTPSRSGAFAFLMRGPLPGVGADMLYVSLELAADSPARPWIELLPLWHTNEVPANFDSIELRIDTEPDPVTGALVPHARVRTCTGADCALAGSSFSDLLPYAYPQDDPDSWHCDARARDLAPPIGDASIDPIAPLGALLLLAPEPGTLLAGAIAASALAGVRRARSSLFRHT